MIRILLLLLMTVLISGAACNPSVPRKFPDAVAELKVACPEILKETPDTDKLSDVLSVVVTNYGTYHECKIKVDGWIDWYNTQKKIFDSVQ